MTPPMILTGPDKAALVIMALDEDVAAPLLSHLSDAQLKQLAERADGLDPKMATQLDVCFEEFDRLARSPAPVGAAAAGAYFRSLAARALGAEKAQRILAPPQPPSAPIDTLKNARVGILSDLLAAEHPQLAAVILAQLPQDRAVDVITRMPPERQSDVVARIATITEIPAESLEIASETLARSLASAGALTTTDERRAFDGVTFTAALLNALPRDDSDRMLNEITERSEATGARIRDAMFTFEDLGKLDPRSIQPLMKEVSPDQLLVALKTASEDLRNLFFGAVSSRASAAMKEDLAVMPAMRLSEVETAQRAIVDAALRLASDGKLTLPGTGKEEMV